MRVIRRAVAEFQQTARQQHPRLRRRMLREIASHILPERINRSNPRVVTRKISKFKRKRAHHFDWPQPTKPFRQAIVIGTFRKFICKYSNSPIAYCDC